MIQPYLEKGLDGAVFGFQAETGLHMLRIIVSGAFDEFPKLKFVIGHCGEALPSGCIASTTCTEPPLVPIAIRTCASSSARLANTCAKTST